MTFFSSRALAALSASVLAALLAACSTTPLPPAAPTVPAGAGGAALPVPAPSGPVLAQGKSRWVAVPWSELPGVHDDALHEAWNAWLKSCERPAPGVGALCSEVDRKSVV